MLAENGYTFYITLTEREIVEQASLRKWDAGWYKLDESLNIFQQKYINGTKFENIHSQ